MKKAGGVSWPEEVQFLKLGQFRFQTFPEAARGQEGTSAQQPPNIKGHFLMLPRTHLCRKSRHRTGNQDFAPVPPHTHTP